MNFKQNDKINQVTNKTLVIGMDIAKRTHYACMVDKRGLLLKKSFPVYQSRQGFEYFYNQILASMKEFGKTDVIIGIGPTGHYWLNLAYYLDDRGIPLVMCNPMHVKRSKELDDNLQTKNDAKDALVIARLIKDGRYSYPRILKDTEAELRVGATHKGNLSEELGALKKQNHSLDRSVFSRVSTSLPVFGENGTRCVSVYAISK